jgi:hypothetical protein
MSKNGVLVEKLKTILALEKQVATLISQQVATLLQHVLEPPALKVKDLLPQFSPLLQMVATCLHQVPHGQLDLILNVLLQLENQV